VNSRLGLVALVAVVALSACGKETGERPSAADRHPSGAGASCVPPPSGTPSPASGQKAPDLALACFAGGGKVRLTALGRPAIVNLWASWCEPCYRELPALNGYAVRGAVLVIGVATEDRSRSDVQSAIDDLGITFPVLYDPDGRLLTAVGRRNLPVTLFVTAAGTLAFTYNAAALDTAGFERLAREHLGVA
jgi:thiol-disulfide isomerase/thioredoxin